MNSREKVLALMGRLRGLQPPDEESALMLQALVALSPLLVKALPDDPAQLDRYLERVATGALACRSDGEASIWVHRWDAEADKWVRLDLPRLAFG